VYTSTSTLCAETSIKFNGLYADKDILEGKVVDYMHGTLKWERDCDVNNNDYLLWVGDEEGGSILLDCEDKFSYGKFANDCIEEHLCNAEYVIQRRINGSLYSYVELVASTDIYKGEEIFVSYSKQYWAVKRNWDKLSTDHQQYILHNYSDFKLPI